MEKEFIPYEEALAMKELGFDEKCLTYYFEDGTFSDAVEEDETAYCGDIRFLNHKNSYEEEGGYVSAPLYQQAFRWFREEYKLEAPIRNNGLGKYDFDVNHSDWAGRVYDKYEEAELACLKKLIEIVKEQ